MRVGGRTGQEILDDALGLFAGGLALLLSWNRNLDTLKICPEENRSSGHRLLTWWDY